MVREFAKSVEEVPKNRAGSGIVRQMIMGLKTQANPNFLIILVLGAGKTTVVGPMLCLLLADCKVIFVGFVASYNCFFW